MRVNVTMPAWSMQARWECSPKQVVHTWDTGMGTVGHENKTKPIY